MERPFNLQLIKLTSFIIAIYILNYNFEYL